MPKQAAGPIVRAILKMKRDGTLAVNDPRVYAALLRAATEADRAEHLAAIRARHARA